MGSYFERHFFLASAPKHVTFASRCENKFWNLYVFFHFCAQS